jgi:two-component system response regulator
MRVLTVFIVDDDEEDQNLISSALKEVMRNVKIRRFADGTELLGYLFKISERDLDANMPDIILLDLFMPKVNGRAVLEIIKAKRHLKFIKVIIVTGSEPDDVRTEMMKLGADGFYLKPNNFSDLVNIVREVVKSGT